MPANLPPAFRPFCPPPADTPQADFAPPRRRGHLARRPPRLDRTTTSRTNLKGARASCPRKQLGQVPPPPAHPHLRRPALLAAIPPMPPHQRSPPSSPFVPRLLWLDKTCQPGFPYLDAKYGRQSWRQRTAATDRRRHHPHIEGPEQETTSAFPSATSPTPAASEAAPETTPHGLPDSPGKTFDRGVSLAVAYRPAMHSSGRTG